AESPPLLGPADAPPPLGEQPLVEGAREGAVALVADLPHLGDQGRRHRPGEKTAHLGAPGELLGGELVAHFQRMIPRTCTTSTRPVSPISRLMTKVKNDISSHPASAAPYPCT